MSFQYFSHLLEFELLYFIGHTHFLLLSIWGQICYKYVQTLLYTSLILIPNNSHICDFVYSLKLESHEPLFFVSET